MKNLKYNCNSSKDTLQQKEKKDFLLIFNYQFCFCFFKVKIQNLQAAVPELNLTCGMLTGEERVGESCCGDCCSWSSEVRVSGTTGGCRRCAVAVMVA